MTFGGPRRTSRSAAAPAQARCLHVLEVCLAENGSADGARDDGREDGGDHDDDRPGRATAERSDNSYRENDERDGQDGIDDPADGVVCDSLEVSRDQPEARPDERCEQRRERGDKEDVARAREHAGEHVSTEAVGAEPAAPTAPRRSPSLVEARVEGGDAIAEERAEEPEEDDS